jgi:hypothetical protein
VYLNPCLSGLFSLFLSSVSIASLNATMLIWYFCAWAITSRASRLVTSRRHCILHDKFTYHV